MSAPRPSGRGCDVLAPVADNGVAKFVRNALSRVNTSTNTASFVLWTSTAELPETESP